VTGVGDREILETYLNALSKNTSETDIFRHGTISLLTIVIILDIYYCTCDKAEFHVNVWTATKSAQIETC
jgi:hypothetical protein